MRTVLAAALCVAACAASAQVYRWTDAQGHVHFTDRKPDEVLGVCPPANREATVWSVAVNGVRSEEHTSELQSH